VIPVVVGSSPISHPNKYKISKLIPISTKLLAFRPQGFVNIFIISVIIVFFALDFIQPLTM